MNADGSIAPASCYPPLAEMTDLGRLRVSLACAIINRQWDRASVLADRILDERERFRCPTR